MVIKNVYEYGQLKNNMLENVQGYEIGCVNGDENCDLKSYVKIVVNRYFVFQLEDEDYFWLYDREV